MQRWEVGGRGRKGGRGEVGREREKEGRKKGVRQRGRQGERFTDRNEIIEEARVWAS